MTKTKHCVIIVSFSRERLILDRFHRGRLHCDRTLPCLLPRPLLLPPSSFIYLCFDLFSPEIQKAKN